MISPDVGGGFGNKVPVYPGYVCAIAGVDDARAPGEVGGGPLGEPDVDRLRARLRDARAGSRRRARAGSLAVARRRDRRPRRVQRDRPADAATRPGSSASSPAPTTSRPRTAASPASYTNKAPGGVAYSCSFRIAEAVYLVERLVDCLARELGDRPGRRCGARTCSAPSSSRTSRRPAGSTTRATTRRALRKALELAGYDGCAREQAASAARGELMGIGVSFFTEAVGAGPRKHMDMLGPGHERRRGAARVARPARRSSRSACRPRARGTRRRSRRSSPTSSGIDARRRRRRPRRHRHHALRARHLRVALDAGQRRRRRAGRAQGPRPGADRRRGDARGRARGPRVDARPLGGRRRPGAGRDDPGDRGGGARGRSSCPTGVEAGLDAEAVYDPPNLTFPFGAYVCVVDVDPGTARREGPALHRRRRLRRAHQPDDRRGPDPRRARPTASAWR